MDLSMTDLPPDVVSRLARFNIREVGQLVAMARQPEGILGLTELLGIGVPEVRALADRLRREHPSAVVPPAPERIPSLGLIEARRRAAAD